jgi:nitrile hydratase
MNFVFPLCPAAWVLKMTAYIKNTGVPVSKKKVSRRQFLVKTSAAASVASVAGAAGSGQVVAADDYVQSDYGLRAKALVSVLTKKKLIDPAAIDQVVDYYENKVGPQIGARLVAHSWVDAEFRDRLLDDAGPAAAELGVTGTLDSAFRAVANTPQVHNLVVCTLCSCYPWPLLGLPPTWYKDAAYRARAVIDPRDVLTEFGLHLDEDVEVRVWDSTAEIRYIVIPERPPGTSEMTEEALAALVTRDSMIGAERATAPA